MAAKVTITLEAISEYHEPIPYRHYPSIRVDVWRGEKQSGQTHYYHRCEDIQGLSSYAMREDAVNAATIWLENIDNLDIIIKDIIASIGE
jgi:hypothetical protein